jgi:UTP--glucose-1-phosphate uridylyltransferase
MAGTIGELPFHGLRFEGTRYDCGNKAGFLEATVAFALEREDLADDMRRILDSYRG